MNKSILSLAASLLVIGLVPAHLRAQVDDAERPTPTVTEFAYGEHERQVFDLYQGDSVTPTPLVLYIHGGGFRGGDKKGLDTETLNRLLAAGMSVATINYRLVQDQPLPTAHHDAMRALQTLRARAGEWNIDPSRVAAFGASSGAQISMWLAYHDDMAEPSSPDPIARQSTRLSCVAPIAAQTTNDYHWWLKNLPEYHEVHIDPVALYGTEDPSEQFAVIRSISALDLASADDPPTFLHYWMAPDDPIPPNSPVGWKAHHINFGIALKQRLDDLGVEAYLHYRGAQTPYDSVVDFLSRKLTH